MFNKKPLKLSSLFIVPLFALAFSHSMLAQQAIDLDANIKAEDLVEESADDANAQNETEESNTEDSAMQEHTITVYVDATYGRRTRGAAKKLTKTHQEYEKQGYIFSDLELYVENSDLRGFFVTYKRDKQDMEQMMDVE